MMLGLCIPLAVLLGFLVAGPIRLGSLAIFGLLALVLVFPLVIRWHHPLLVVSWNAAITPSVIPGRPHLWMLMAGISFLLVILNRSISHRYALRHEASITRPLMVLLLVVILTACLTGGIGMRTMGSASYGGRNYVFIVCAVAGYFGLCSVAIPHQRARFYTGLFFLSGLSYILVNVAYSAGPSLWWLLRLLPAEYAIEQALLATSLTREFARISSLAPASVFFYSWLLATYGINGLITWRRPLRPILFLLAWVACIYSGFRYALGVFLLLTLFQFFLEGVHRTRLLPFFAATGLLVAAVVVTNADRMPVVVQRTISFLPVKVSDLARTSAEGSTEWRMQMWRRMIPQIPQYLLLGKGYAINPNDLQMAFEADYRGYGGRSLVATQAGDYHSGPLSIIIPFGIWGTLALLWFWAASIRYLYRNYRWGNPRLKKVNTLLLALYAAKVIAFIFIFGAFNLDLPFFVGVVGFAVALNKRDNSSAPPRPISQRPESVTGVPELSASQSHELGQKASTDIGGA